MADKRWKVTERKLAERYYNSKRRGADTSRDTTSGRIGKSDIPYPGASIEVKDGNTIGYALLWGAVIQATNYTDVDEDIAVAHLLKKGMSYYNVWTGLSVEDWGRLVTQTRFGISRVYYTIILPRGTKFYNKNIERSLDHAERVNREPTEISVTMFQGAIPPVIVLQRMSQFYEWFLKNHNSLINL